MCEIMSQDVHLSCGMSITNDRRDGLNILPMCNYALLDAMGLARSTQSISAHTDGPHGCETYDKSS